MFETEIFDIVANVDETPCYLCARMRRGYLYKQAMAHGCNKIALGHHFDDVIETVLMGMLYSGQIQTMMPKLHSTNHPGMELIRPLYMVKEADIIDWAKYNELKFIQCACRFTENCTIVDNAGGGSKRQEMKTLINRFRQTNTNIEKNIFRSIHNVNLDTVIGYKKGKVAYNFLDDYQLSSNKTERGE
jgi:tRNA(Ile)-lysidine synthase TilS/MesJ